MRVAVTVDRNHPDRVDVDWESVFGEIRGGIFGRAAELLADGAGVGRDLSKGPPPVEGERALVRPGTIRPPLGHRGRRGPQSATMVRTAKPSSSPAELYEDGEALRFPSGAVM